MVKYCLSYLILPLLLLSAVKAQEPTANPTNLVFSNAKSYGFSMSFTPSAADSFLVLKSASPISFVPIDGVSYQKGEGVALGVKVVSRNSNSFFNVREVVENTTYYFRIFAFNGVGANANYKQTAPLEGNFTSPPSVPGIYFNNIDSSSYSFLSDLKSLLYTHNQVSYTSYRTLILPVIFERDSINNTAVVNCEYSNGITVYTPPFDFTAQQYNREHALPKSWMLTGGNTNNIDGSDYHNLLLTLAQPNQARSNHPLGIVLNVTNTYGEGKIGTDAFGNTVFEPKDNRKGDAARCMFYQMVTYNGNGGNWGFDNLLTEAPNQDQGVLKLWHNQDPPDKFERTKTDYIYSIQGNRNPFIDHPGWVNCINFDSLVKTYACGAVSAIAENSFTSELNIKADKSNNRIDVNFVSLESGQCRLSVLDIAGRLITETYFPVQTGQHAEQFMLPEVGSGIFLLTLEMNQKRNIRKFVW